MCSLSLSKTTLENSNGENAFTNYNSKWVLWKWINLICDNYRDSNLNFFKLDEFIKKFKKNLDLNNQLISLIILKIKWIFNNNN